jgi:hypothetical protein
MEKREHLWDNSFHFLWFFLAYPHCIDHEAKDGFWGCPRENVNGGITLKCIDGYESIICGLSAIYAGLAQVLNEMSGKTVAPVWPVKK